MTCVQTYSPSDVSLVIALIYPATDFAPDSIISITKDEDYFNVSKGANGNVDRTHLPDKTYSLEISLSQTSPTNTVLNALATLDSISRSGMFPIFAKDSSGQSLFLATSCWIENPPIVAYTDNIETRTWTVRCAEMTFGVAGNSDMNVLERVGQLGNLVGQFGGNYGLF